MSQEPRKNITGNKVKNVGAILYRPALANLYKNNTEPRIKSHEPRAKKRHHRKQGKKCRGGPSLVSARPSQTFVKQHGATIYFREL